MMSVHVADEEVEDRHVHDVEQSPALVVRPHLLHDITVILNKIDCIKTHEGPFRLAAWNAVESANLTQV